MVSSSMSVYDNLFKFITQRFIQIYFVEHRDRKFQDFQKIVVQLCSKNNFSQLFSQMLEEQAAI